MRLFHVYGPRDSKDKFAAFAMSTLLDDSETFDLTLGKSQRDFIYVEDVANAFSLVLGQIDKVRGPFAHFDVGSGQLFSIRDFVSQMKEATASETVLNFGALPERENEINIPAANIEPLTALGWQRKYSLQSGLLSWASVEKRS